MNDCTGCQDYDDPEVDTYCCSFLKNNKANECPCRLCIVKPMCDELCLFYHSTVISLFIANDEDIRNRLINNMFKGEP